ncbi:MAG: hypothetical protein AAB503_02015 [Patescibacteria group bacterium]
MSETKKLFWCEVSSVVLAYSLFVIVFTVLGGLVTGGQWRFHAATDATISVSLIALASAAIAYVVSAPAVLAAATAVFVPTFVAIGVFNRNNTATLILLAVVAVIFTFLAIGSIAGDVKAVEISASKKTWLISLGAETIIVAGALFIFMGSFSLKFLSASF